MVSIRTYGRVGLSIPVRHAIWLAEVTPSQYGCAGSLCGAEASQRDPQVARQTGTVTESGSVKAARGTPQHMPLVFIVFIGADGCYKSIRKGKYEESRVE